MSKEKQTTEDSSLENFTWDTAESANFFGVPGSAISEDEKADSMKKVIEEVAKEDEEEEDEENDTFFGIKGEDDDEEEEEESTDEEEEEDEEDDKKGDDKKKGKEKKEKLKREEGKDKGKKQTQANQTDGQFFKTLASEMIEKKVFQNVEIEEDKEELTEEEFFALQDQEIEARVDETFEAFFTELDEDGKQFLKFKKNGGRTADFINMYVDSPVPDFGDKDFDVKNETHRKVVLETYLTLVEKLDDEELQDRLDWLKEQGKDVAMSEKYYGKLVDIDTKQKEALLKQTEIKVKEREDNSKAFIKTLSEALNKVDTIGKFKITKDDKKKLVDLITKPTVKIDKNKYVPSFHVKLGQILNPKTPESLNNLILLAKLIESNFDIKDLTTKVETEVVSKVKSKLRDAKNGIKPSSSGSYENRKTLSDFFNE